MKTQRASCRLVDSLAVILAECGARTLNSLGSWYWDSGRAVGGQNRQRSPAGQTIIRQASEGGVAVEWWDGRKIEALFKRAHSFAG